MLAGVLAAAVALSILGLGIGPLLLWAARGRGVLLAALDGLTLGLVPAVVLLRIVPHLCEEIGPLGLALPFVGLAAMALFDRRHHRSAEKVGHAVVLPALALHALTDGMTLGLAVGAGDAGGAHHGHDHGGELLASGGSGGLLLLAVLLHRLPEGLFLATLLGKSHGARGVLARLALLAAATAVGALGGHELLARLPHGLFEGVVALGLGAMLWLVLHAHGHDHGHGDGDGYALASAGARRASGAAFLASLGLVLLVPDPTALLSRAEARELPVLESLGPLFVETAPAVLAGLGLTALLGALVGHRAKLGAGSALSQALRGAAIGAATGPALGAPGAPLARSWLASAPAGAIAIAIGAGTLDLGAAAQSARLLGGPVTLLRVAAGGAAAVLVALAVARAAASGGGRGAEPEAPEAPEAARSGAALPGSVATPRQVLRLVTDGLHGLAAFYVVGLLAAAGIEAFVEAGALEGLGAPLDVALAALAGAPLFLGGQGATPVAAILVHKGLSAGAAVAWLVAGPALGASALLTVRRILGLRAALACAAGILAVAAGAGLAANGLIAPGSVPDVHALLAHQHLGVEWAAAAALALLLALGMLRLGPRAFFGGMGRSGLGRVEAPDGPDGPGAEAREPCPSPEGSPGTHARRTASDPTASCVPPASA